MPAAQPAGCVRDSKEKGEWGWRRIGPARVPDRTRRTTPCGGPGGGLSAPPGSTSASILVGIEPFSARRLLARSSAAPDTSSTARQVRPRAISASTTRESPPPTSRTHVSPASPACSISRRETSGVASNQLTSRSDFVRYPVFQCSLRVIARPDPGVDRTPAPDRAKMCASERDPSCEEQYSTAPATCAATSDRSPASSSPRTRSSGCP